MNTPQCYVIRKLPVFSPDFQISCRNERVKRMEYEVITIPHTVPSLRMSGALRPLHQYYFTNCYV